MGVERMGYIRAVTIYSDQIHSVGLPQDKFQPIQAGFQSVLLDLFVTGVPIHWTGFSPSLSTYYPAQSLPSSVQSLE